MKLFKRSKYNAFKETLCLPCVPWHLCSVSVARVDQRGHTHHPWFWLLEYPVFLCWDRIWKLFRFSSDHPACVLGPWRKEGKNQILQLEMMWKTALLPKGKSRWLDTLGTVDDTGDGGWWHWGWWMTLGMPCERNAPVCAPELALRSLWSPPVCGNFVKMIKRTHGKRVCKG